MDRLRIGATNSTAVNLVLDDILLASGAMPGAPLASSTGTIAASAPGVSRPVAIRAEADGHVPPYRQPDRSSARSDQRSPRRSSCRRSSLMPKWWAISWWTVSMTAAASRSGVGLARMSGPRKIVILLGTIAASAP